MRARKSVRTETIRHPYYFYLTSVEAFALHLDSPQLCKLMYFAAIID